MKFIPQTKFARIVLICLIFSSTINTFAIWDQQLSRNELSERVNSFNQWYKSINPNSKLETRLAENNNINVFSTEEIKSDEEYFSLSKNHTICGKNIYDSQLGQFMTELEQKYGYDEYTNLAIYTLFLIGQNNSTFKPYLDLLPRQPHGLAFQYWNFSNRFESEVPNMPIIRKIVEYKLLLEKKSKIFQSGIFEKNVDLFNPEIFNKENIEWVFLIIDSRAKTINYELCLVPMIDFVAIRENPRNPSKVQKISVDNNQMLEARALSDFSKGEEVYDNLGLSNDLYLIYHGLVLENNLHDCYSLQVTFSERKEDSLMNKRKDFFQRFFMFDKAHIDLIEECLSVKNPFSRRVLFYFYTCLMEDNELDKQDPKRTNLEEDKLILEYAKERLRAIYDLFPTKLEEDEEKLNTETDYRIRLAISFKIEQKKYLLRLVETYNDELLKLIKEDIL